MKIVSIILIAISVFLSVQHGWQALRIDKYPAQLKMLSDLQINKTYTPFFGALLIAVGLMILFPKTFFIGNLLNTFSIISVMALALKSGNIKIALIEIPFLIMPLVIIWLKYPFKFN